MDSFSKKESKLSWSQWSVEKLNKIFKIKSNKRRGNVKTMPLELNCELFGWLGTIEQCQLIPELCRGIYAMERKNVKRKLKLKVSKKEEIFTRATPGPFGIFQSGTEAGPNQNNI